ncbi:MAG: hypothetical protein PUC73_12660 [Lachnospiraceae bacterium]|nr:hypothetical protein [Lachnospiraceae bacterium]
MRSNSVPKMPVDIPMPPIKCMNEKSKIKRVYEDDSWVIDLIDGKVRVSYFEDCHFVDEIMISKDTFKE